MQRMGSLRDINRGGQRKHRLAQRALGLAGFTQVNGGCNGRGAVVVVVVVVVAVVVVLVVVVVQ